MQNIAQQPYHRHVFAHSLFIGIGTVCAKKFFKFDGAAAAGGLSVVSFGAERIVMGMVAHQVWQTELESGENNPDPNLCSIGFSLCWVGAVAGLAHIARLRLHVAAAYAAVVPLTLGSCWCGGFIIGVQEAQAEATALAAEMQRAQRIQALNNKIQEAAQYEELLDGTLEFLILDTALAMARDAVQNPEEVDVVGVQQNLDISIQAAQGRIAIQDSKVEFQQAYDTFVSRLAEAESQYQELLSLVGTASGECLREIRSQAEELRLTVAGADQTCAEQIEALKGLEARVEAWDEDVHRQLRDARVERDRVNGQHLARRAAASRQREEALRQQELEARRKEIALKEAARIEAVAKREQAEMRDKVRQLQEQHGKEEAAAAQQLAAQLRSDAVQRFNAKSAELRAACQKARQLGAPFKKGEQLLEEVRDLRLGNKSPTKQIDEVRDRLAQMVPDALYHNRMVQHETEALLAIAGSAREWYDQNSQWHDLKEVQEVKAALDRVSPNLTSSEQKALRAEIMALQAGARGVILAAVVMKNMERPEAEEEEEDVSALLEDLQPDIAAANVLLKEHPEADPYGALHRAIHGALDLGAQSSVKKIGRKKAHLQEQVARAQERWSELEALSQELRAQLDEASAWLKEHPRADRNGRLADAIEKATEDLAEDMLPAKHLLKHTQRMLASALKEAEKHLEKTNNPKAQVIALVESVRVKLLAANGALVVHGDPGGLGAQERLAELAKLIDNPTSIHALQEAACELDTLTQKLMTRD